MVEEAGNYLSAYTCIESRDQNSLTNLAQSHIYWNTLIYTWYTCLSSR